MLTSSFQTVIKRYNSNSQEIKIKRKVDLTFKSSIYSYANFVCAQNNFRLTRTKKKYLWTITQLKKRNNCLLTWLFSPTEV